MIILFKLINASAMFQIYSNNILREHLNVFIVIYFNNILVYLKNKKDYKKHVKQILNTLKKVDLRIILEKSQFY